MLVFFILLVSFTLTIGFVIFDQERHELALMHLRRLTSTTCSTLVLHYASIYFKILTSLTKLQLSNFK